MIIIHGGPKQGKTTLAVAIKDYLEGHGVQCLLNDSGLGKNAVDFASVISQPVKIEVVDSLGDDYTPAYHERIAKLIGDSDCIADMEWFDKEGLLDD